MKYFQDFPDIIRLGTIERPCFNRGISPSQVRSADDLPLRLFLANLDPISFHDTGENWTARYADLSSAAGGVPETRVDVTYNKSSRLLGAAQYWHGVTGPWTHVRGDDWKELLLFAISGFPEQWSEKLRARFTGRYNIAAFVGNRRDWCAAFFPDGFFVSTLCIVPIDRLSEAYTFVRRLDGDPRLAAPVSAHLELSEGAVNYVEGRCPDVPSDPHLAFQRAWDQTGLRPSTRPVREARADSAALTVRRRYYSLVVESSFRDLEFVVERLHAAGFVGDASDTPEAAETRAVVLTPTLRDGREIRFYDTGNTRRVVYWTLPVGTVGNATGYHPNWPISEAQRLAREARSSVLGRVLYVQEPLSGSISG